MLRTRKRAGLFLREKFATMLMVLAVALLVIMTVSVVMAVAVRAIVVMAGDRLLLRGV